MAVYTVHEPPLKRYETAGDPDRFVFVRDGFSFWAFLFGPVWMLRHRMWLVLIGYVALAAALQIGLQQLHVENGVPVVVGMLLALLIGFEAGTLRRFALARRRWTNVGVIVGDDREVAEQRFFDAWVKGALRMQTAAPDVMGLAPQPGVQR
jgi:hypothetical protein